MRKKSINIINRIGSNKIRRIGKAFIAVLLATSWLLTGWPGLSLLDLPSPVSDVLAADAAYGSGSEFNADTISRINAVEIGTDKFVICYVDGSAGFCRVGSVTGTTISWGTEAAFDTDGTNDVVVNAIDETVGVCKLTTDKFAVVYTNESDADGKVRAGSVSGTTITFGNEVEYSGNGDTEWEKCVGIATDKIAIGYNDEGNSDTAQTVVCTADSSTPPVVTCGAEDEYSNGSTDYHSQWNAITKLNTDKYLGAWRSTDGAVGNDGYMVVVDVSGTTTTPGTVATVTTDNPLYVSACSTADRGGTANQFVLVYKTASSTGRAVAGTVSGTTITLGSEADFNPTDGNANWPGCTFTDETHFLVAYEDLAASENGKSAYCTVNWSTRAVTCNADETFAALQIGSSANGTDTEDRGITTISGYGAVAKVAVGYVEDGDGDDGMVVIGDVNGILVSGTIRQTDESTADTTENGTVVKIVVEGGSTYSPTINGSGFYSQRILKPTSGNAILIYVDDAGDYEGAAVTVTDGATDISMDLFEDRLIMASDKAATSLVLQDLVDVNTADADDLISSVTTSALTVATDKELHINTSDTFAPGGSVTTAGTGGLHIDNSGTFTGGTTQDHVITGNVDIDPSATLTAPSTEDDGTIKVGGNWTNDSAGVFTANNSKVTFTATTGTKTINTGGDPFYDLTLGESSGTASFNLSSSMDVTGDMAITYGTLGMNGSNNISTVGTVDINTNGAYSEGSGTWTFKPTGTKTFTDSSSTGPQDLGIVSISSGASTPQLSLGSNTKVSKLTLAASHILYLGASSYTLEIAGDGATAAVFSNSGTLSPGTSTVKYSAINSGGSVDVATAPYNNLQVTGADTYVLTGNLTGSNHLTGTLTIGGSATLDTVSGSNYNLEVQGNWVNSGTFTANSGTVTLDATSGSPTITSTTDPFYNLSIDNAGTAITWTLQDALDVNGALLVDTSNTLSHGTNYQVNVAGNLTVNGAYSAGTNTTVLDGAGGTTQAVTGSSTFSTLSIINSATRTVTFASGSTQVVTDLTLGGSTSCNNLLLIRASSTSAFTITNNDASYTVSYVDFQYTTVTTNTFTTGSGLTDSGNNTGITFDNTCEGGSSSAIAGNYSFQRKTFLDATNTVHWLAYHDNDEIEFKASVNNGTNWTRETSPGTYDTNDFSLFNKTISATDSAVLAVKSGDDIIVRRGNLTKSGSDPSVTWESAVTALDGTGATDTYANAYVNLDSSNYIWVMGRYYDGANYVIKAVRSNQPLEALWSTLSFGTAATLSDNQTDANTYGNVVPLASRDMYATFTSGTALEGCRWDDDNSPTPQWEDTATGAACSPASGEAETLLAKFVKNNFATSNSVEDGGNTAHAVDVAVDKDGVAHVVWISKRYNATYYNIDYVTIQPDGTIGSIVGVSESSTYNNSIPSIAVDANNKSHISWHSRRFNATYYNIDYNTVTDAGSLGTLVGVTESSTYNNAYPAIAVDSNNKSHISWHSYRFNATYWNIDYNTVTDAGSLGTLVGVTESSTYANTYPAIAVDSNNKSHISWYSNRFNATYWNIDYNTVTDAGSLGTLVGVTESSTYDNAYPAIAVDSNNKSHITWYSRRFNATYYNIDYNTVTDAGSLGTVVGVSESSTYDNSIPSIAVDSNNKSHITWYSNRFNATYSNIDYNTVTDAGSLGTLVPITENSSYTNIYPQIDYHPVSHKIFVVWIENTSGGDYEISYTRNNPWSDNDFATANSVEDGGNNIHAVDVAVDKDGVAHVVWMSKRYDATYYNIDYVTIQPDGTVGTVIGVTSSSTYQNYYPAIAVDSNNKSHISWYSNRFNATYFNIDYNTVTDAGSLGTLVGVTESSTYTNLSTAIDVDGNNKSHISWYSNRFHATYRNIDYNTVTDAGSLGTLVGVTESSTYHNLIPAIAVDSNNKSHISWYSKRFNGLRDNIDYNTVTDAGSLGTLVGVTSSTIYDNYNPAIAVDSNNKSHTTWHSKRSNVSYFNIDYNTVTDAGSLGSVVGVTSSSTYDNYNSSIAVDSNNKSHISWYSNRFNATYFNIDYNTVTDAGSLGVLVPITENSSYTNIYPQIDYHPASHKLFIVWAENTSTDYEISFTSRPGDWPWDANRRVTSNSVEDGGNNVHSVDVAVDKDGVAHVVWWSKRYNATYYNIDYVTIQPDGTVGTIIGVTESSTYHNLYPAIAVDSNNKSHISWQSYRFNASYDNIDYNTVTDAGSLGTLIGVTESSTYRNYYPAIAVDSNNKSHISWYSTRFIATYYNIDYNTVTDAGSLGSVVGVSQSSTYDNSNPAIAVDSNNKSHISWQSYRFNATYYNIDYNTVTDADSLGTLVGVTESSTYTNLYPAIAVDSNNKSHISWYSRRFNATYYNIDYNTVTDAGGVERTAAITSNASYTNVYPQIDYNPTADLLFTVWIENTVNGYEISFTRKKSFGISATPGTQDAIDTVPSDTEFKKTLSAVSDSTNYDVHLVYTDASPTQVSYKRWDNATATWQSAALVPDATGANDFYPSISINTANRELTVFWIDTGASVISYAQCPLATASNECSDAADWGAEQSWKTSSTFSGISSDYGESNEYFAQWMVGSTQISIDWGRISAVVIASFTQNHFRWYVNPASSENVTDPWSSTAGIDLNEDTALMPLPFAYDPPGYDSSGNPQQVRLRVNITVNDATITANSKYFKLQFRTGTDLDCSTGSWTDVGAAGGSDAWVYTSETGVADDTTLTVARVTGTDKLETYSRVKPANTPEATTALGQNIEFDFHIVVGGTSFTTATRYLFRVVETTSDGSGTISLAGGWNNCPVLHSEPGTENLMRHGNFYSGGEEQGFYWAD